MALKTHIKAYISPKGIEPLTILDKKQSKFPREVEINIYSKSRIGNWLLKKYVLGKKLILVDINILGW